MFVLLFEWQYFYIVSMIIQAWLFHLTIILVYLVFPTHALSHWYSFLYLNNSIYFFQKVLHFESTFTLFYFVSKLFFHKTVQLSVTQTIKIFNHFFKSSETIKSTFFAFFERFAFHIHWTSAVIWQDICLLLKQWFSHMMHSVNSLTKLPEIQRYFFDLHVIYSSWTFLRHRNPDLKQIREEFNTFKSIRPCIICNHNMWQKKTTT